MHCSKANESTGPAVNNQATTKLGTKAFVSQTTVIAF